MTANEVRAALPAVAAVLADPDENVRTYAAVAVYAISLRSDSAMLLTPYIKTIGSLLNWRSPRLFYFAELTLIGLRPSPPREVLAPFSSI